MLEDFNACALSIINRLSKFPKTGIEIESLKWWTRLKENRVIPFSPGSNARCIGLFSSGVVNRDCVFFAGGLLPGGGASPLTPRDGINGGGGGGAPGKALGSSPAAAAAAAAVAVDYSRYVKRFSSAIECGSSYCKDLNYRYGSYSYLTPCRLPHLQLLSNPSSRVQKRFGHRTNQRSNSYLLSNVKVKLRGRNHKMS